VPWEELFLESEIVLFVVRWDFEEVEEDFEVVACNDDDDEIEHDLLVVVFASWIPLSIFQHFVFEIL
jgi:hypothetical protein